MTIATDLADFRIDNATDINRLPDAVALRYYNDCRDMLIDAIIAQKEDFFYDEITNNIVSGQREYTIPKRGDLATDGVTVMDGLVKTKSISIKFKNSDTEYTKLPPRVLENLDYDLRAYHDSTDAFFIMSDDSNFLYPTPTENITNGMITYGILYPKKLILTDSETLPDQHKKAILLGVAERWFTSQRMPNEAALAGNKFKTEVSRVATALSGRIQAPKQITTPCLRQFS